MGRKKDIGNVFEDKLRDFSESPSDAVWDAIASEIDQNSRKRIVPFWYYFGAGILAVTIIFGLLYIQPRESNSPKSDSIINIVTEENSSKEELEKPLIKVVSKEKELEVIASDTSNSNTPIAAQSNMDHSQNPSKSKSNKITKSYSTKNKSNNNQLILDKKENTLLIDIQKKLAILEKSKIDNEENARKRYKAKIAQELNEAIATQKEENKKTLKAWEQEQEAIAQAKKKKEQLQQGEKIAQVIENHTKQLKIPKTDAQRDLDRKESTEYALAISPYTSLLSYGSLARGSSIDDRLVDNPREAINTTGYGIRADYSLNEKVSIRFGIGFAPLKYRTENFQVSSIDGNINIFQLSGINTQNLNQNPIETSPEAQAFFNQNDIVSIEQDISYIEVPVDFQYRILNKRIALSLNTGLSLFVLNNNSVFATADSGQSILIGQETDLNSLSLAFNLGLGTHYNVSKKWRFDAEPVFKYQLNPYIDGNSNFRPYYFGLQFGLSYKF